MSGPAEESVGKAVGTRLDVEGAPVHQKTLTELEVYDDDGHIKRTGNYWTTSSHIITAVIGSGVLSLAWSVATMGWIGGVLALTFFPLVTLYCSNMLIDCYRWPTKDGERRNYKYIDAVAAYLPQWQVYLCGFAQYVNLIGTSIGYTITAAISLVAIDRGTCFHFKGHDSPCGVSVNNMILLFGILQVFLSQCPDLDRVWLLSVLAAIMSYFYSTVILVLSIVNAALPHEDYGSLGGTPLGDGVTAATKTYGVFQGLGNIAFAYSFSNILIEITVRTFLDITGGQGFELARKVPSIGAWGSFREKSSAWDLLTVSKNMSEIGRLDQHRSYGDPWRSCGIMRG